MYVMPLIGGTANEAAARAERLKNSENRRENSKRCDLAQRESFGSGLIASRFFLGLNTINHLPSVRERST